LQLLLLSLSHILQLTKHFFGAKVFKFELSSHCLSEVHVLQALLSIVVQQPKE